MIFFSYFLPVFFKLLTTKADGALVDLLVAVVGAADDLLKLVRKGVPLDAVPGGASVVLQVAALLDKAEVLLAVAHRLQEERDVGAAGAAEGPTHHRGCRSRVVRVAGEPEELPGVPGAHRRAVRERVAHVRRQRRGDHPRLRNPGRGVAPATSANGAPHVPAHQLLLLLVRMPQALVSWVQSGPSGVVRRVLLVVVMVQERDLLRLSLVRLQVRVWVAPHGRVVLHPPHGVEQPLVPGRRRGHGCWDSLVGLRRLVQGGRP